MPEKTNSQFRELLTYNMNKVFLLNIGSRENTVICENLRNEFQVGIPSSDGPNS